MNILLCMYVSSLGICSYISLLSAMLERQLWIMRGFSFSHSYTADLQESANFELSSTSSLVLCT